MPTDSELTHSLQFFATCPRGLQDALAKEVLECGAQSVAARIAGVYFSGSLETAYRLNLTSRIASRVLLRVGGGRFRLDKDLYKRASQIAWEDYLRPDKTLRVDTKAIRVNLTSLKLVNLRVKDAIVDRLRENFDARPDIDTVQPDTRVVVFLEDRDATFYLDLSGENLFKRGWRGSEDKGDAPIKENLAAGLLAESGWSADLALFDPFCGSGTIAIEAAQQMLNIAPGLQRDFGARNLSNFDSSASRRAHDWAHQRQELNTSAAIFASDIDNKVVSLAKANARRAGLPADLITLSCQNFLDSQPPTKQPGWIVSNLPYGERINFEGEGNVAQQIGAHLRAHYAGWTVCLFSGDLGLPGKLGLRPKRKIALYNGTIDCRLFIFDIR